MPLPVNLIKNLLNEQKGRFFIVDVIKENGDKRRLNGKVVEMRDNGLVTIKLGGTKDQYRSFYMNKVERIHQRKRVAFCGWRVICTT